MFLVALVYAFIGALAGISAGLLGIGGGLVIVPMLSITLAWQNMDPNLIMHVALGTSMASIIFTSLSSSRAHHKRGAVNWKIVAYISPGILIGSFCSTYFVAILPTKFLQIFFVVFLIYASSQMILDKKPKPSRQMPAFMGTSSVGIFIGFISSLVGIGGGTLSVPFMVWHNVPLRNAIGTSSAIGFPIAIAGTLGYVLNGLGTLGLAPYSMGFVYLPALAGIVIMSILTAPIGVRMAHTLPVSSLKKVFAILLIIVGIRMFMEVL